MCRKMKCCAEVNVGKYSCAGEVGALARFVSLPDDERHGRRRGSRIIISGVIISLLGGESALRSSLPRPPLLWQSSAERVFCHASAACGAASAARK